MNVSKQLLDAVPGCNFSSESAVISAAKKKLGDGAKTDGGTGIEMGSGGQLNEAQKDLCASMSSFSVNTYSWDSYIDQNKAGGVTSINLSSGKESKQPGEAITLSIKVDEPTEDESKKGYTCMFYDEDNKTFSSNGCK